MLANRYAVWTDPATDGHPAEDVALSELAIGTETGEFQPFDASDDNLREVLDTGLFSSRGPARIGWAHQSYAEFLAAHYLVSKRTSPENVMKILRHPNGGLVPQLWMVAAWAASRDPELRRRLIEQEPFTLLRGDLLSWTADDLAVLTQTLLAAFQEQRAHDFAWGIANEYRKLAHSGLPNQLRPLISNKSRNVVARRAALMIARACGVREVGPDILVVALDTTDDPSIRAQAVSALETCADETIRPQLLPLAKSQLGPDPVEDIKGNALRLLWPRHLTSTDLFGLLTMPGDGHVGAYVMFVTRELPESLAADDFVPALHWIAAYARNAAVTGPIQPRNVCDGILMRAWTHADRPAVRQALVAYVDTVLRQSHQLFMSAMHREDKDFKERVHADVDRRRRFLLTVLRGTALRPHDGWLYWRAGFLHKDDLEWLLSICPEGVAPVVGLNDESLCVLISAVFDPWDPADLELAYDIAMAWAPLHQRYTGLLDGVPLDSAEAVQMKSHHQSMLELDRNKPPLLDPPPDERVRRDLTSFETGEIDAWWHLNINLTLTPTSTHFDDLQLNIAKMVGWAAASEDVRERILRGAKRFLEEAVPLIDTWLGTNSYKCSDRAAYRAFFLLRELDPTSYAGLSSAIWRKWAAVIVAVQKDTGGDDGKIHEHILGDAARRAPREAADTVQQLIRHERRQIRKQANAISAFFLLRELRDAWGVPELQRVVFAELNNRNNSPVQFESLLDPLLQSGFAPAQALAKGMLRAPSRATAARRPYTLAAAVGWLSTHPCNAWPQIWRWIERDPQFGSELFQKFGRSFGVESPFYSRLDETQAGQLYVWLERHFPARDDARNQRLGRASWVGPAEMVAHLRDGVLRDLVNRGTEEGVAVLRRVVAQLADRQWLAYQLLEAEQTMRIRTWQPLMPHEVIAVTASAEVMLVQSARQLEEILIRTLRKYEGHLHGEQTPVRALWDRQANGSLRPVDEDALSDHVRLFLKHELVDSGIVANREVEIGRVPGARLGSRTDIKVEALRKSDAGRYDVITAVIETKGCWNAELLTAMTTQLVDDYMVRLAAPAGIYLVGWFDKRKWDAGDARRARTPDLTFNEVQSALDAQAAAQPGAFTVQAVVLDCHAP